MTLHALHQSKSSDYISRNPIPKRISFTFDDGPHHAHTSRLLDIAVEKNVKLTFFVVGRRVLREKQLVKRMADDGHEIGNHSWSHPNFATLDENEFDCEMSKCNDAIVNACGVVPRLMRPPYGIVTEQQRHRAAEKFGYRIVLWNIDPKDWQRPPKETLIGRIVSEVQPQSIILAHDLHENTVLAASSVFDALLNQGFAFVRVSDLLQASNQK